MSETIEKRLADLGVTLPAAAAPAANYVPFVRSGNLLFTAGQLPLKDGKLQATRPARPRPRHRGRQGSAQNSAPSTSWRRPRPRSATSKRSGRMVKITVFVASAPDFIEQHLVANGASDFLVAVLGERGKHARSAVGMASLPLNAAVEIEAIIEVE